MRTSAYEFGASGGWRTVPSLTKTLDISMTLAFFPMLVSHLESPRSSSPSPSPASRHFAHSSPPGLASFQTSHHLKPPSRRLFAGRSCPNRAPQTGRLKTTETDSLTVPKAGRLPPRCGWNCAPSAALARGAPCLLFSWGFAGRRWRSSAGSLVPPWPRGLLVGFCLCVRISLFLGHQSCWTRGPPLLRFDFHLN